MKILIGTLFYISIATFVVSFIVYNRERSIFLQKISYLNRRINSDNIKIFKMPRIYFDPTHKNNLSFVNIKQSNMDNLDYANVVKKFKLIVLTIKISLVLASLIFIVITILT